jgi:hypothetical protein
MNIVELLTAAQKEIIEEALHSLSRAHLNSYEKLNEDENRERLNRLYSLVLQSVKDKALLPVISYSEKIAKERYESGFDFKEVHSAYNVLEEVIWKKIIAEIEAAKLGEALGLVSTVLGAGKQSLAAAYISLSSKTKIPSLDLTSLFSRI